MAIEARIIGGKGRDSTLSEAHVHPFDTGTGRHHGLVVSTERFITTEPLTKFFSNETVGIAMNQTITFGGSGVRATVIHAGVNSGSAESGITDGSTTTDKLIQSGQNFNTTVGPGALVHNTTDSTYALVTAVDSDTQLSLGTDIMATGENYVINDIWPGTAVQGTWNFADSNKFTITSALNNDEATFTVDANHIWNATDFVSFTGKVDLDTYNPSQNTITLGFGLDGVVVGNTVNLDDFIDTGDFTEQSFVIAKDSLGLSDQNFNSMRLCITRSGGTKPTIKFDDFQWENTGTPITFSLNVDKGDRFHIRELVFAYRDNIDSISTVTGATENVTNSALDTNAILGLSALTNGFVITRSKGGETIFSANIKTLGGHISAGAKPDVLLTAPDGSSTFVVLRAIFPDPLILTGEPDDTLTIQINDSMSDLLQFTVAGRGSLET